MSAPVAGDFSCADLQILQTNVTNVWQNGGANLQASYRPKSAAAAQVLGVQNARFEPLKDASKKLAMKVFWVDSCTSEITDCPTDYCDVTGQEGGATCVEYDIDQCVSTTGYSVTEQFLDSSELTFDQVLQPGYTRMLLAIEDELSRVFLNFLCDNAGVNQDTLSPWPISGDTTYIPASGWNGDMMGYLDTALAVNELNPGVLIATQFLRTLWLNTMAKSGNPTGAAEVAQLNAFGTPVFDLFQMPSVLGTCTDGSGQRQGMFMYDPNSVALVTRSEFLRYGAEGRVINGTNGQYTRRYAVRGLNLPIDIDMIYTMECIGKDIRHTWKPFINYGLFLNPMGCNTDRTGILKFVCGTAS